MSGLDFALYAGQHLFKGLLSNCAGPQGNDTGYGTTADLSAHSYGQGGKYGFYNDVFGQLAFGFC
jgi:hypothetical protein